MLEAIIGPTIGSIQIELEENFPPVNPHPKQSIGEVMYLAGQRSVVEHEAGMFVMGLVKVLTFRPLRINTLDFFYYRFYILYHILLSRTVHDGG